MARGTYIVNESFLIVALLLVKKRYFDLDYVTRDEVELFETFLVNKLKKDGIIISVSRGIFRKYLIERNSLISIDGDSGVTLNQAKNFFQSAGPGKDIISIIWDKKFVYNNMYSNSLENPIFSDSRLDIIIEKILDNPEEFYGKIAKELSEEEYIFLNKKIMNKCCDNCSNGCKRSSGICKDWKNDSMVGKLKLLKK